MTKTPPPPTGLQMTAKSQPNALRPSRVVVVHHCAGGSLSLAGEL
jgi:hypothetical protein